MMSAGTNNIKSLITLRQAHKASGVSYSTLRREAKARKFPVYHIRNADYVNPDEFNRYINSCSEVQQ